MKLRYTPRALAELDAILDYIGQGSPSGAARVRARIRAITVFIRERPRGGQQTNEAGLRRMVATPYPYIVFYEVKEDEVTIVGVRHGARDPDAQP